MDNKLCEHFDKWVEVAKVLNEKHPGSNVTLWVNGYVDGLRQAIKFAYPGPEEFNPKTGKFHLPHDH